MKNYVASLFTFFEKVFEICTFFTVLCLDVRFWDLLCLICLKFNPQYWYLLLRIEKCVNLIVIFNKERDLYKTAKLCLLKIFILCWTTKVNFHEFSFFYTQCKMHIIHFTIFWTGQTSRLFVSFHKKRFSSFTQCCLLERYI